MKTYINPSRDIWGSLCVRPSSEDGAIRSRVLDIIGRVRSGGDDALRALSREIDGIDIDELRASEAEFAEAAEAVSPAVKAAVRQAAANIEAFHKAQMPRSIEVQTSPGVRCIQKPVPIGRVGLYIPGGTAPLFSTVLMLALPAKIARCGSVILCTPASRSTGKVSPEVLWTARECGVTDVFKVGGAQAIAAMALGTSTIPGVDKIFGPGNRYVTTAKQILGGTQVAIDMPAGPSEVMVIADESASPAFVAADLLSQAEHGVDSQVMLVCRSERFALEVQGQVEEQLSALGRGAMARGALDSSRTVVFTDDEDVVAFANTYAPEHLIINTSDPWSITGRITAAGSVFVGPYTPESAGDYASGTNHTLPTCGWARSHSGVNIDSFMRKMTVQEISREGLAGLSRTIVDMAEAEGLGAHANAVKVRMNEQ